MDKCYELSETIISTPRKSAIVMFHLAKGHNCRTHHLQRLKIFPFPSCVLCDSEEDMDETHYPSVQTSLQKTTIRLEC